MTSGPEPRPTPLAIKVDQSAPRKATNLSVNRDLLRLARAEGLNLSQELERALLERLAERGRQRWLSENRAAIDDYNTHVAVDGAFANRLRQF